MPEVFNNRKNLYISQTAPVEAGACLLFSILLHDDCNCSDAWLVIHRDGEGEQRLQMRWAEKYEGCFNRFETELVTERAGLYWYHFEYDGNWQRNIITCFDYGRGDIRADGSDWQLTVYEKGTKMPDGFSGGLIYQIFPDRFYASGAKKSNVPEDRYICEDWYVQPAYLQNGEKRSLCNDYYGGDLKGIESKLGYLKELGVTIIYLNPIFEAHSNHRYNTADYFKIDASLGTEEDFVRLCSSAKKKGIRIILDGVFSHTGADSKYYNMYSRYSEDGAYNSQSSPYYSWFKFTDWPNGCHCWWGVPSLPEVNEDDSSFTEYICGENGVLRYWLRLGASGWRLDVADELPDRFLDKIRQAIKAENPDALLIGEVWEDASNKISHGGRRRFLLGEQLDSVMNYPFRDAIIRFVMGAPASEINNAVEQILCNYPKSSVDLLMNHIGTHDTERILSVLSGAPLHLDRAAQAQFELNEEQRERGKTLLRMAALIQYTLPGIPSLYYGDEAGLEGLRDPFNRMGYPWGREDKSLVEFYKKLGKLRKISAFDGGTYSHIDCGQDCFAFIRTKGDSQVLVAVNRGQGEAIVNVPSEFKGAKSVFGKKLKDGKLTVEPMSFAVLNK